MRSQRAVIDYTLAKRATLAGLRTGRVSVLDVCDANPYLTRAAKYLGEPAGADCPVCRREPLVHVTYVYGDQLGEAQGRVKATRELAAMAAEYQEFAVYVVEVCRGCGWNHLASSYTLGEAPAPARRARRRAHS